MSASAMSLQKPKVRPSMIALVAFAKGIVADTAFAVLSASASVAPTRAYSGSVKLPTGTRWRAVGCASAEAGGTCTS